MHLTHIPRTTLQRVLATMSASATAAVIMMTGGVSLPAQAASFKCGKDSSFSEKEVCNNAFLSRLDDKLAKSYARALDVTPDRESLEADRDHQWKWRQQNCHDNTCVINWYERRISELDADFVQGKKAQRVAFELNVDRQHLAPSAQAVLRDMRTGDHATVTAGAPTVTAVSTSAASTGSIQGIQGIQGLPAVQAGHTKAPATPLKATAINASVKVASAGTAEPAGPAAAAPIATTLAKAQTKDLVLSKQ